MEHLKSCYLKVGEIMWKNETIFSIGDLSGTMEKEYNEFIDNEYDGDLNARLEHVEEMIKRLEFEKKIIKATV